MLKFKRPYGSETHDSLGCAGATDTKSRGYGFGCDANRTVGNKAQHG